MTIYLSQHYCLRQNTEIGIEQLKQAYKQNYNSNTGDLSKIYEKLYLRYRIDNLCT